MPAPVAKTPTLADMVAAAQSVPPRALTSADLRILHPLATLDWAALTVTPAQFINVMPDFVEVLAHFIEADAAVLHALPLHIPLAMLEAIAPAWIQHNADYFARDLNPVVARMSAALATLAKP